MLKFAWPLAFLLAPVLSRSQPIVLSDPQIQALQVEVSKDSLRSYLNVMVSFRIGKSMEVPDDQRMGIGTARNSMQSVNESNIESCPCISFLPDNNI